MALRKNVLQEDDILCELYVDTCSGVSDYSDNESLDSDADVSTTSSRKELRSSVVVTVKQVQMRKKVVNWGTVMTKQMMYGVKLIKNQALAFPWNHRSECSN